MSKNKNIPNKGTKSKAPAAPPKKPETKQAEEQIPVAEEVSAEEMKTTVATNPDKLARKVRTLSPDAQVMALNLLHKSVVAPEDPALAFPEDVKKRANHIVAIGSLCALADHAANGDDSFAYLMQKSEYKCLAEAAQDLGFKLPKIEALPVLKDGSLQLDAKEVKIPAETKKALKEEQKIREGAKPELDPEKITSEEDLKKALTYMFAIKSRRLVEVLTESIDFMKKFRLHEASLAENADEAKAKFENYNSGDWLDDLFSYIKPSVFFTGIGRGMANIVGVEKNIIHAFIVFRDAIKTKDNNEPVLDDQEIAYCVRSIIKWCCNNNIESNKKAISELDAKKNTKEIEVCNKQIAHYNAILDVITNPSFDGIDALIENLGSKFDEGGQLTPECQAANKMFNQICKSYYGKSLSTVDYKNVAENVKQYAYHIVNLFRSAGEKMPDVGLCNISALEERSQEEKDELIKKSKKEWAEKKKEEQKNA